MNWAMVKNPANTQCTCSQVFGVEQEKRKEEKSLDTVAPNALSSTSSVAVSCMSCALPLTVAKEISNIGMGFLRQFLALDVSHGAVKYPIVVPRTR